MARRRGPPRQSDAFPDDEEEEMHMSDFEDKQWKPLTKKVRVPPGILSPYRFVVMIRIVALLFFLKWHAQNPNPDAMLLWGLSIVCEIWFTFSWLLDQLPKLNPISRTADIVTLRDKFEKPDGSSDLPGLDIFVSTADPEKEPPLVTVNTILSILSTEYPVQKLSLYISDDGGAPLTFEAMEMAADFAKIWTPFCRKHDIEPRNPESYFAQNGDPTKNKKKKDFLEDRMHLMTEYNEFKIRINDLPDIIKKRSKCLNEYWEQKGGTEATDAVNLQKATWSSDGRHWPGTWLHPIVGHQKEDHGGIIKVLSSVPEDKPVYGDNHDFLELTGIDKRLPMFAYVSREKKRGYDCNKKAGAMNALLRASAILSNGPFILNLDHDHYIYNSLAIREGMCYMMDRGGDRVCYVQFPQRFEGVDPSDRYANPNNRFFESNMRALDGLQGPMCLGTGCLFRRYALYGFNPPREQEYMGVPMKSLEPGEDITIRPLAVPPEIQPPNKFGISTMLFESIPVAEYQGRPLAEYVSVKNGRPPGVCLSPRPPLDSATFAEAISVISCWYEERTEWGTRIGWIYGSVTEDVVTGYRMHNQGWHSVYCVPCRDAFRGTAPINLTDRLHLVLRWSTGSVEVFFSRNNAFLASRNLKFLQRVSYLNVSIYPFTSVFLLVYCLLPALCLFSGQFIVHSLNATFLAYLLLMATTLILLSLLEVKWSGIPLQELWRNEQFWLIGGTSAQLVAVLQGLLKVIAGSFTLTAKSAVEEEEDTYDGTYILKWSDLFIPPFPSTAKLAAEDEDRNLFIPPLTIIIINLVAVVIAISKMVSSEIPQWSKLFGGLFFSLWVLAHMYPFAKGLMESAPKDSR